MLNNFLAWPKSDRIAFSILSFMVLAYCVFFSAYQIQRQNAFENSLDTLSIEQPLWNTLHGQFLRTTYYPASGETITDFNVRKTYSLLGDHVQPSLLIFLIPYAILPNTETLLVVFCTIVGLGAIPMYRISRRRLSSPWLALLFASGYLLLPAVETNTGWDIHGANLLPPLLLAALDAAETGHIKPWWGFVLLAMGFREDFPIFVGWAMIWMAPKALRKQALIMAATGLVISLTAFLVIIPYFGGGGTPYIVRFFPTGTPMTFQGIVSVLEQPYFWQVNLIKFVVYNVRLGAPLLFLYFGSSSALLAMAPLILANSLSWYAPNITPDIFHYTSPIISWALIGSVDGYNQITHFFYQKHPKINWQGIFSVAFGTCFMTTQFMTGYTPLSRDFIWPGLTGRETIAQAVIDQIPRGEAVSVEPHLSGHFSHFKTVYLFPDVRDAQWILLDIWYGSFSLYLPPDKTQMVWNAIMKDPTWETVIARDGLILLKKGIGPPRNISQAYRVTNPKPVINIRFGGEDGVNLVNLSLVYHSKVEATLCTDWDISGSNVDHYPQMQFMSTENVVGAAPMDTLRLSPIIFTEPGSYRICIRRMGTGFLAHQRELQISMATNESNQYQVSIINSGKFVSYVRAGNNILEIDMSGIH